MKVLLPIFNIYQQIFNIFRHHLIIVLTSIGSFVLPIRPLLLVVGLMIFLDTVTGLIRSHKLKIPITSRKLSQLISKLLLYNLAIISVYIMDVYLLGEFLKMLVSVPFLLTKITSIIFVSIEGCSINENCTAAFGLNFFTEFKKLLSRAQDVKNEINDLSKDTKPAE